MSVNPEKISRVPSADSVGKVSIITPVTQVNVVSNVSNDNNNKNNSERKIPKKTDNKVERYRPSPIVPLIARNFLTGEVIDLTEMEEKLLGRKVNININKQRIRDKVAEKLTRQEMKRV